MKNDSKHQQIIQLSIERAEKLVRSADLFTKLKDLSAPETVITSGREIVSQNIGDTFSDKLAKKLLPQAQNIASMRETRFQYLSKNTFLGFCENRFEDLFIEFACQDCAIEDYETKEEALDVLERAIRAGNQGAIVGTIVNVLKFIEQDLVYRDEELPTLPPRYIIPFDKSGNLDVGDSPSDI
jgi:hypothetical protein